MKGGIFLAMLEYTLPSLTLENPKSILNGPVAL